MPFHPTQSLQARKTHFAVMAIGATARKMHVSPTEIYNRLNRVGLVKNLLLDCYDVLHTESLEGVVWNVQEALKSWEKTEEEN